MKKKGDVKLISGNLDNKYETKNLLSSSMMKRFLRVFDNLLDRIGDRKRILEVGSGEGYLIDRIIKSFPKSRVIASDYCGNILKIARTRLGVYSNVTIKKENAERLSFKDGFFDLVICCEVLEHLKEPMVALKEIRRVLKPDGYVLVSVPLEPIWRILNVCRFKYLGRLGNTPGHLNHWSYKDFLKFLESFSFKTLEVKRPFPWTMVLLKK